MILMTGATGTVGTPLLKRLLASGEQVRCLVREPRRLGPSRVQVQIALGNLGDRHGFDRALRGVDTVIHLAATMRDQSRGSIEELNGLGTARLIQAARRAGVKKFVYISSFGASAGATSRFIRQQALSVDAIRGSGIEPLLFEAGVIYAPDDPWISLMADLTHLPLMPVIGDGRAAFQPIWAEDAADAIAAALQQGIATPGAPIGLAGPETLTQNQILKLIMRHFDTRKPLVHIPVGFARKLLEWQEAYLEQASIATWDEVALLQHSILARQGTKDLEALGITPAPMADVLPVR
jgi:NADH dehydrogenase